MMFHDLRLGMTKAINALFDVSYTKDIVFAGKTRQNAFLQIVGILKFIHQDHFVFILHFFGNITLTEKLIGKVFHITKIHHFFFFFDLSIEFLCCQCQGTKRLF